MTEEIHMSEFFGGMRFASPWTMIHGLEIWGCFDQCHLDKNDTKNSVYRNVYSVLFLWNFHKTLDGINKMFTRCERSPNC